MKDVEKMVDSNGVVMQIVDGAARDMIAAEYDETASYAVGDYCIYNDHYYKCNTAIPSGGETWDATHWDATTLGAENKEIKSSLSYYKDCQSTFSNSAWQGVYYADYDISSIVNQGYKATGIIPTDVNSNRPCYGYLYANGAMARVCTTSTDIGGTTVKFRVTFQKGESL